MYRRGFVAGASALTAMAANQCGMSAMAQSCPPVTGTPPSHPRLSRVCIGNSEFALPDNFQNDTTSNSLNSRKLCFAPTRSDITDIVLAFPGFGLNNPEQDLPASYTVAASVEYPIGTAPRRVYFSGAASVNVLPGRVLVHADPLPITIPAGAQFAVKTYATWTAGNFWLGTWEASLLIGEWTTRGTGLPDHTLDNIGQATTGNLAGFGPVIFGTLATPVAAVGLIGDSWGGITNDWLDPSTGYNGWGRAMRGAIPFINLCRAGDAASNYFNRPEGRNLVLRDSITHLIWEMGGNDLFGGAAIGTMISNLEAGIAPFLDRGVKCYAMTLTPRSNSTDGWLTAVNQTLTNPAIESVRVPYNTWLLGNWATVGLSGVFDIAHAVDPTDSGKWNMDAGMTYAVPGPCSGFATLSNGVVASVASARYNSNSSAGSNYPPGSIVMPCMVYAYSNTGGSGAVVSAVTDPVYPWIASYQVVNGGGGYGYPPMIATRGNWTGDSTHPNSRGWGEVLHFCTNLAPETFVL